MDCNLGQRWEEISLRQDQKCSGALHTIDIVKKQSLYVISQCIIVPLCVCKCNLNKVFL